MADRYRDDERSRRSYEGGSPRQGQQDSRQSDASSRSAGYNGQSAGYDGHSADYNGRNAGYGTRSARSDGSPSAPRRSASATRPRSSQRPRERTRVAGDARTRENIRRTAPARSQRSGSSARSDRASSTYPRSGGRTQRTATAYRQQRTGISSLLNGVGAGGGWRDLIADRRVQIIALAIIVLIVIIVATRCSAGAGEPEDTTATQATTPITTLEQASTVRINPTTLEQPALAGLNFGRAARKGDYSISVTTTGDIMFAREVSNYVDMNGGASPLANLAATLSAADVTFANLECPLTDDESQALIGKDVLWRSNPAGIEALESAGIDFVSLANNHIMDYGAAGLKDTLDALDAAGIKHAGAGLTEDAAGDYAETEIDGVSIAFLSWTDIIPDYFLAFGDNAGVVSARMNMDDACKRVAAAKKTHDVVVVAMHWGIEYQEYFDAAQQQDPAHQLVDAGADIIWGNHPHVIQGIEFYKGSIISYSQGDFVCDHYSQETGETFVLNFDLTPDGIKNITAIPVYLDDTYGIPSIVTGDEAQNILERLERISEGQSVTFTIQDDIAHIEPTADGLRA